jgi:hypothetical protein
MDLRKLDDLAFEHSKCKKDGVPLSNLYMDRIVIYLNEELRKLSSIQNGINR